MRQALFLFLSIALLSSVACKTKYVVRLEGGTSLNTSIPVKDGGSATPVKARIYQLKDAEKFRTSSFDSIWDDAEGSLGADLLDKGKEPTERTVMPRVEGEKNYEAQTAEYLEEKSLDVGTVFFGVTALFKPSGESTEEMKAKWKAVVSVEEIKSKYFLLDNFELTIKDK